MSRLYLRDRVPREYNAQIMVQLMQEIQDQLNRLSEGNASAYHGAATAAPTIGAWVRGDWVKNSAPSSAGYFGFVCTVSGTPGTWKSFGLIA